ncbi:MAG: flagellar assembly protein FliH [Spirochaetaceae bacterium]|nr:flagellar assembly protein FliH [Spirochaetaceae bacterium]
MAKSIYKNFETKPNIESYAISLTKDFSPQEEVIEIKETATYTGPTIDELKQEADEFRRQFEIEKQNLLAQAQAEADKIIKDAETAAFSEVKKQTDDAQVVNQKALDNANTILSDAEKKAATIVEEAESEKAAKLKEAYDDGFNRGREEGYREGELEVNRLIDRMHVIINKTMDRRQEILSETEQQIVDLVLLMTRKVVKVISENQRNVVVSNIVHALRKVKGRGDVTIRVNLLDVALTTEHTKNFLSVAENVNNITVVEDSTVDPGGCIIDTDFGAIDARISSQLNELEQKILEISPIKTKLKTGGSI